MTVGVILLLGGQAIQIFSAYGCTRREKSFADYLPQSPAKHTIIANPSVLHVLFRHLRHSPILGAHIG